MKSIDEIQKMLVSELWKSLERIRSINLNLDFYNKILGDTSFLLAGLLELLLKNKYHDWDSKKWIDDSLITKVKLINYSLSIWGVMIWGITSETEQWTEPFYFEIELDPKKMNFSSYTLLFCDVENPEITYENFKQRPDNWDNKLHKDNNLDSIERNWKYIINIKNELDESSSTDK